MPHFGWRRYYTTNVKKTFEKQGGVTYVTWCNHETTEFAKQSQTFTWDLVFLTTNSSMMGLVSEINKDVEFWTAAGLNGIVPYEELQGHIRQPIHCLSIDPVQRKNKNMRVGFDVGRQNGKTYGSHICSHPLFYHVYKNVDELMAIGIATPWPSIWLLYSDKTVLTF